MNVFAREKLFQVGSFQHGELFSGCTKAWESLQRPQGGHPPLALFTLTSE
jgi:hypothetical protein